MLFSLCEKIRKFTYAAICNRIAFLLKKKKNKAKKHVGCMSKWTSSKCLMGLGGRLRKPEVGNGSLVCGTTYLLVCHITC